MKLASLNLTLVSRQIKPVVMGALIDRPPETMVNSSVMKMEKSEEGGMLPLVESHAVVEDHLEPKPIFIGQRIL